MIDQVELHFFQSHLDTFLDFDPGVNVITGSSDSGKTAIMRFILWVLNNRPLGDEFKSWFAKENDIVSGGIAFSEGTYITKERNRGKNVYDVNGTTLEAVKSDVPDELKAIANFANYNIQTQHQPYFLLQDTPGEVARKLNELIGLDVIDTIFSNLNSSTRDLKGKELNLDNQIKSLNEQIQSLSFLDEIQAIVNKLEQSVVQKEKIESESRGLHSVIGFIEDLNTKISEIEIDPNLEKEIIDLLSQIKDYQRGEKQTSSFNSTLRNLITLKETITAETEWLEIEKSFLQITKLISDYEIVKKDCSSISYQLNQIKAIDKSLTSEVLELKVFLTDHKDLLKKAKICPFCKTPITDITIQQIEDSL